MQEIINLLKRFIQDDIERHSNRLRELDKKPIRASNDTVKHNVQGVMEDEKACLRTRRTRVPLLG